MFAKVLNVVEGKPAIKYAFAYLMLIPFFAVIYMLLPEGSFKDIENNLGIVDAFYFSVITITTLGYGDITPTTDLGKIFTAVESIFGLIFIGLFLNELSHQYSNKVQEKTAEKIKIEERIKQIETLLNHDAILQVYLNRYLNITAAVTSPAFPPNSTYVNYNFTFNDLHNLYQKSMSTVNGFDQPVIVYYFNELDKITQQLFSLITNGHLDGFPRLKNSCLLFYRDCNNRDHRSAILEVAKNPNRQTLDSTMIKTWSHGIHYHYSNAINPYIGLYFIIHDSFYFIEQYEQELRTMKKELISLVENDMGRGRT